jgi:hypothetical protein
MRSAQFTLLVEQHSAASFVLVLHRFIAHVRNPHVHLHTTSTLPSLPFDCVNVFHHLKLDAENPLLITAKNLHDIVHSEPA